MIKVLSLVLFVSCWASQAMAAVKLNGLFGDHMVLQRNRPIPIWGTADAGEEISVTLGDEIKTGKADAEGKWMVILDTRAASKTPLVLKVQGTNRIEVTDVLVGDVWLGMGQSNMDWTVSGTDRADEIRKMTSGRWDGIRMFKVEQVESDVPVSDVSGKWLEATPPNVVEFSAILFYFGEELRQRMPDVPLGLIRSSVGATNLYCWLPNEVRDLDSSSNYLRNWWIGAMRSWSPAKQNERDQELADYLAKVEEYKQRNEDLPGDIRKPGELLGPKWSRRPSALYNGMIAPLHSFAIRGMIWYQGEWDAKSDWTRYYYHSFTAFAEALRGHWATASGRKELGDFPIYIVQLPAREPGDGDYWPYFREVQAKLGTDLVKSGYVVTLDTNDPHDLHPRAKMPVGQRLAWLALAREYEQSIPYHGPEFKSAKVDGNGVLVSFDIGAPALKSRDGQPLRCFEVAGSDGVYHPAAAEIRGNDVFVSSPNVKGPKTVRYAFAPAPENLNFCNSEGLPAAPFRTDTQPIPDKIR